MISHFVSDGKLHRKKKQIWLSKLRGANMENFIVYYNFYMYDPLKKNVEYHLL